MWLALKKPEHWIGECFMIRSWSANHFWSDRRSLFGHIPDHDRDLITDHILGDLLIARSLNFWSFFHWFSAFFKKICKPKGIRILKYILFSLWSSLKVGTYVLKTKKTNYLKKNLKLFVKIHFVYCIKGSDDRDHDLIGDHFFGDFPIMIGIWSPIIFWPNDRELIADRKKSDRSLLWLPLLIKEKKSLKFTPVYTIEVGRTVRRQFGNEMSNMFEVRQSLRSVGA